MTIDALVLSQHGFSDGCSVDIWFDGKACSGFSGDRRIESLLYRFYTKPESFDEKTYIEYHRYYTPIAPLFLVKWGAE